MNFIKQTRIAMALGMLGTAMINTPLASAQISAISQLTVEITGLNEQQGKICLNLFDGSAGFPGDRNEALQAQCVAAAPTSITFDNLQPGSYAVAVFHDANDDDQLNRNFLGMPTEGFGFSQNPEVRTGPPAFGEAVILVAGPNTTLEIQLNYF